MRPEITGELARRAREAADKGDYETVTEFVRDAVRRRVEEVLDKP